MAYIPKNKIQTDLYSNGDYSYLDPSKPGGYGPEYYGKYYSLSTGKAFTGKFPGDGENLPLIKRITDGPNLSEDAIVPSLVTTSSPPLFPTDQDYKNGFFIRYFSKKRNEYLFEELEEVQYIDLNQPNNRRFNLYKPFSIKWMLTGDKQTVTNFNFYSVKQAEEQEKVYGLNEFLKMDYTKYYK
jgi:hypothetical protein